MLKKSDSVFDKQFGREKKEEKKAAPAPVKPILKHEFKDNAEYWICVVSKNKGGLQIKRVGNRHFKHGTWWRATASQVRNLKSQPSMHDVWVMPISQNPKDIPVEG